ncbi:hypothetical protein BJY59DRAFT_301458 [Rhodotorula toruloides]
MSQYAEDEPLFAIAPASLPRPHSLTPLEASLAGWQRCDNLLNAVCQPALTLALSSRLPRPHLGTLSRPTSSTLS